MKSRVVLLLSLVLMLGCVSWLFILFPHSDDRESEIPQHLFDITRAYIIALKPDTMEALASSIRHFLRIPHTHMLQAINGTQAPTDGLSLYTKYLMLSSGFIF